MSLSTSAVRADLWPLVLGAVLLAPPGRIASAEDVTSATAAAASPLATDPMLESLVAEALAQRPELAQARATLEAERERVEQAGALPDPVFSAGIQNDGFSSIQIGEMETSWLSFTASQTFPWHGKRDLRGEVTTLAAQRAEVALERSLLSTQAEVERAYLDLLLVRDQLGLLAKLETLWTQAEGMARARYEAGDGTQSDVLRAQLEQSRLKQRRLALAAEEQRRVAALNRLRGHPLEEPISTLRSLAEVPDPVLPDSLATLADAEARSPELHASRLAIEQSQKLIDLAEKDYYPDLTVTAGVMPRWGNFETMWLAGVSFPIPIWSGSKQSRAIAENQLRETAAQSGAEAARQLLHERMLARRALLAALIQTNHLYRSGLLVQSEATVTSTTAQYQVGRVTFASVLEALTGYVADRSAFLESVAATQRLEIAQRELSLDSPGGLAPEAMGAASMPGAGSSGMSSPAGTTAAPPSSTPSPTPMSRM